VDGDDFPLCVGEEHVQRQESIFHPKFLHLAFRKDEDHPRAGGQGAPVHEALSPLSRLVGDLNGKPGDHRLLRWPENNDRFRGGTRCSPQAQEEGEQDQDWQESNRDSHSPEPETGEIRLAGIVFSRFTHLALILALS